MVFRISGKLAKKIDFYPEERLPLDPNPFADWSCHLFTAARVQYIIVTNTVSLYSLVLFGRGITDWNSFLRRVFDGLRDLLKDDGVEFLGERHVLGSTGGICLSRALNHSVVGSMNDLAIQAKSALRDGERSPYDVSFDLNDVPMGALKYRRPREVFQTLKLPRASECDESGPESLP